MWRWGDRRAWLQQLSGVLCHLHTSAQFQSGWDRSGTETKWDLAHEDAKGTRGSMGLDETRFRGTKLRTRFETKSIYKLRCNYEWRSP